MFDGLTFDDRHNNLSINYVLFVLFLNDTGFPKMKLALGKHFELALHCVQMGIYNPKKNYWVIIRTFAWSPQNVLEPLKCV